MFLLLTPYLRFALTASCESTHCLLHVTSTLVGQPARLTAPKVYFKAFSLIKNTRYDHRSSNKRNFPQAFPHVNAQIVVQCLL